MDPTMAFTKEGHVVYKPLTVLVLGSGPQGNYIVKVSTVEGL